MKIVVIGPDHAHSMGTFVSRALKRMGHDVWQFADKPQARTLSKFRKGLRCVVDLADRIFPRPSGKMVRNLRKLLRQRDAELVIAVSVHGLYPEVIRELRRDVKCRLVAWFPDPVGTVNRQFLLSGAYDCVFTKCRDIADRLAACGCKGHYLPEACEPEFHARTEPDPSYACEITTAASLYYYRLRMFEILMDRDMKLWGSWPRYIPTWHPVYNSFQGRDVYLTEKAKAFSSAEIVVNTLHPGEGDSTNVRLFEAACSGSLVLCEYRPVVEDLFEVGRQIDVFRTRDELRRKALHYLENPEAARTMGESASRRARTDHTYEKRLQELLEKTWEI